MQLVHKYFTHPDSLLFYTSIIVSYFIFFPFEDHHHILYDAEEIAPRLHLLLMNYIDMAFKEFPQAKDILSNGKESILNDFFLMYGKKILCLCLNK